MELINMSRQVQHLEVMETTKDKKLIPVCKPVKSGKTIRVNCIITRDKNNEVEKVEGNITKHELLRAFKVGFREVVKPKTEPAQTIKKSEVR